MVFFLHFLLRPSEQLLDILWGPCDLALLGHLGKAPAAFCSCKSTSVGADPGVGGTGLVAGRVLGVLLVGAEQLPRWLCCTGLSNLTRRCTAPGNIPRSTSKLPTFRLCPSAATELGRAAEAQVSAQSSASFPAAVRGTAATRSSSFQAQCQGFPLLLVKLGYHLNPHSSCMNH